MSERIMKDEDVKRQEKGKHAALSRWKTLIPAMPLRKQPLALGSGGGAAAVAQRQPRQRRKPPKMFAGVRSGGPLQSSPQLTTIVHYVSV
jgi:hypothetical protein